MNWKNRLKNYNFWISLFSAVLLVLQALKVEFDVAYINEIFTAVLGLLVVIGIISDPTKTLSKSADENFRSSNNSSLGVVAQKNDEKTQEDKALPIVQKSEVDELLNENNIENVIIKQLQDLNGKVEKIKDLSTVVGQNISEVECGKVEEQTEEIYTINAEMSNNNCSIENYDCNNNQELSDLSLVNEDKLVGREDVCDGVENIKTNEKASYLNLY